MTERTERNDVARRFGWLGTALILALLIALISAGPVWAYYDEDSGTQGCGSNFVEIQSRAKGNVTHEWPEGTPRIGWYNALTMYRYSNTSLNSTSWLVGASVNVVESNTYAYCVPIG